MKIKFKHVAFVSLLVAGIGLEVGGIFLPPLIPVGAVCLAGAIAMTRAKRKKENTDDVNDVVQNPPLRAENQQQGDSGSELDVNVSVKHKRNRKHDNKMSIKPEREHKEHDGVSEDEKSEKSRLKI